MNAAQAVARIRKALGKRAQVYDYKKPSSQEQRDAARREALELRKEVLRLRKNLAAMVAVPLIDDLKMARGAAAACNLYGAVRAIDRAIEAL